MFNCEVATVTTSGVPLRTLTAAQAATLDALGETYLRLAGETGIDPALMHRIAVIGSGTLDSLPHNGAVVTLLAVCAALLALAALSLIRSRKDWRSQLAEAEAGENQ